jgi:Predicted acyltransferases
MDSTNSSQTADIGDYMKVFACTAVMMQSVLTFVLKTSPSFANQNIIGFLYNLVKFTAPAFIFGILYTTTRQTNQYTIKNYPAYLYKQWLVLFIPTICWTLIYLLVFPQLQQHFQFNSLGTFLWQFVNGNAAPHLWYNTMMLQFIILMPIFWLIADLTENKPILSIIITITTVIFYLWWLYFYSTHASNGNNWYLLDRVFISFIIYGILGTLTWINHKVIEKYLPKFFLLLLLLLFITFYWTNFELFSYEYPVKLTNAPYYKLSMTLYALTIIGLIATLALHQLKHASKLLPIFHFLAIYAYRAYLSNVFWLQIIWTLGGQTLAKSNPILAIISCYLLTWVLSFTSAYVLHIGWLEIKQRVLSKNCSGLIRNASWLFDYGFKSKKF